MARRNSQKWTEWRKRITWQCENLVRQHGSETDIVPLRDIVAARKVRDVTFRPLLAEGGLAIEGDGFIMYVNCDREVAADFKARFYRDGGTTLPSRVRFTIAHELMHTFFFDLSGPAPKSILEPKHDKDLENLEQTCDYGANTLLLPEKRIRDILESQPEISPDTIKEIAQSFGVSAQSAIIRLQTLENWGRHHGAALFIEKRDAKLEIASIACDLTTRRFFKHFRLEDDVREHVGAEVAALEAFGGSRGEIIWEAPCRIGAQEAVQPVKVSAHSYSAKSDKCLLTLILSEQPRIAHSR